MVQVGDLVHRGPDSNGVIRLVDGYLRNQPDHWIQLIGNHETVYLRSPAFAWPDRLRLRSARQLRRWWREGRAVVAVALRPRSGCWLGRGVGQHGRQFAQQPVRVVR